MIKTYWVSEDHTLIQHDYYKGWTWEDLDMAITEANKMMETVNHTVHVVVNMSEGGMLPKDAFTRGRTITNKRHPNEGMMITVGANQFLRSFVDLFRKLYPKTANNMQSRFASTLEEAYSMVEETRVHS